MGEVRAWALRWVGRSMVGAVDGVDYVGLAGRGGLVSEQGWDVGW